MRKIGYIFITLSLLVTLSYQPAAGQSEFRSISHKIGTNTATVEGKQTRLSVPTEIRSGTTFIFSADLGKLLGIKFPWSPRNKMAGGIDLLTNTSLSFKENFPSATIDGDEFKLGVKPYIKKVGKDEFFMIPLKYSCQVFGCSVSVDKNKNLSIKKPLSLPKIDWTTDGRDQSRSFLAPNGYAPKGQKLVEDWGFKKGHEETSMLYFDGKVLSNDILGWTCFDAETKKQLWKKGCSDNRNCEVYPGRQLAYCNGKVLNGDGPTAYDANTGEVVWKLDETNSDCVAFDGILIACKWTIYVGKKGDETRDVDLNCYQVSDGKKLWSINLFKKTMSWGVGIKKIASGNGRFLLDWKVYETQTGKFLYSIPEEKDYKTMNSGLILTSYIKASDSFAVYNKEFIKLFNARTGKLINERRFGIADNIAVKGDRIYCINIDTNKLTCLNTANLDTIWSNPIDPKTIGKIAIVGFQIVSVNPKFISGFGTGTGKQLWNQDLSHIISGYKEYNLAVVDRYVYITTWMPFQRLTYRFSVEP
jgi:hypothetical protein